MATEYNKGYEAGYIKAKLETEIKYQEELAALKDIKAEYDRAFVMCRQAGVSKELLLCADKQVFLKKELNGYL